MAGMDMAVEESVGETEEKALKLIDTDVHNYLSGMDDLMPFLSERWKAYVKQGGF